MKIKSIIDDVLRLGDIPIGKEYDVIAVEDGWYRIIDESGEDYIYPPELFEVTDETGCEDITYKRGKKVNVE